MSDLTEYLRQSLLKRRIQRFTQEELGYVLDLLRDSDPHLQRLVGDALIRTGSIATPVVVEALNSANPLTRRSATFILGELLKGAPDKAATQALRHALKDVDPKVRKNVAVALGKIADMSAVEDLAQQMRIEPMNYVRPSIILALGKIGGNAGHQALTEYVAQTEDDERALQLAVEQSSERQLTAIQTDVSINCTVDLLCRFGTESFLIKELSKADIRHQSKGPGYVRIEWHGTISDLFQFRCYDTVAFPLLEIPEYPLDRPYEVADVFANSPTIRVVSKLTQHDATSKIRYRVTFDLPPRPVLNRRDWTSSFKDQLEQHVQGFLNSPSRYSWELLIRYNHNSWYLAIRPTAYKDPRFAYRVTDVPAALNPSVAAAMTRLIPCNDDDIVLDPFCGSGTPLIERGLYAPYQLLIGIDHDDQALTSAEQNIKAAEVQRVKLLRGDSHQLQKVLVKNSINRINTIITNPPYGVRVGSQENIKRLYPAFMRQAANILQPGSYMVMLAKEGDIAQAAAQQNGFITDQAFRVDTGGILVWLFVFQRR